MELLIKHVLTWFSRKVCHNGIVVTFEFRLSDAVNCEGRGEVAVRQTDFQLVEGLLHLGRLVGGMVDGDGVEAQSGKVSNTWNMPYLRICAY